MKLNRKSIAMIAEQVLTSYGALSTVDAKSLAEIIALNVRLAEQQEELSQPVGASDDSPIR